MLIIALLAAPRETPVEIVGLLPHNHTITQVRLLLPCIQV